MADADTIPKKLSKKLKNDRSGAEEKKKMETIGGNEIAESVELEKNEKAVSVSIHGHKKRITKRVVKEKKKKKKRKNKEEKSSRVAKGRKKEKVYELPGQKHNPPYEGDPLRIFYESLYEQRPTSEMAAFWLMERGLLPEDVAKEVYAKQLKRKEQKRVERQVEGTTAKKSVKVIEMNSATSKTEGKKVSRKRNEQSSDSDNDLIGPKVAKSAEFC